MCRARIFEFGLFENHAGAAGKENLPYVSGFSVSEHLQYCVQKCGNSEPIERPRVLYHEIIAYEMQEILAGRGNQQTFQPMTHLKKFLLAQRDDGIKIGLVTSGLYRKAMPEIVAQVGLGLSPEDDASVIGIEAFSARVMSVALTDYAVVGRKTSNIQEAGLDGLLSAPVTI